mgnify:CR=1 FL=1
MEKIIINQIQIMCRQLLASSTNGELMETSERQNTVSDI